MIYRIFAFLVMGLSFCGGLARVVVSGTTLNTDGSAAGGVIVRLYDDDKLKAFSTSSSQGKFSITADSISDKAVLRFISLKHETLEYPLKEPASPVEVRLNPKSYELKEVVVKAPERRVKGDTIVYDVAAMTKAGDRNIEDVIKKIPGIQVDDSGGISYDGEPINHFYIEGLDLMGGNYAVASRNISPTDISSVSVYQRHQPTKVLQGKVDSKRAALNLKLKKGRMLKPLGYVSAGAGAGRDFLWSGELYGMLIAPDCQTIISARGNNSGNASPGERQPNNLYNPFSETPFGKPSIKRDRYIINRTAYATANNLLRLNPDLTLTINADYGNDRDNFDGITHTEYLSPDNAGLTYSETADNTLRQNTVNASAKIENNGKNLYFLDQAQFRGNFNRDSYLVNSDALRTQRQTGDDYNFSNDLKAIIKHGRRMYEVSSATWLTNRPLLRMQASDAATGQAIVHQDVASRSFHNRERTSISFDIGERSTLGASLQFSADHDRFSSEGYFLSNADAKTKIEGRQSTADNPTDTSRNDLSGHRIVTTLSPYYKFRWKGLSWTTTIPVSLYNIKYSDILDGSTFRLDRVFVDFNTALTYKFRQASFWELSFGRTNSVGDMGNFIDNPVFTTFRNSMTMGAGNLKKGHRNSLRGAYSFKNFLDGFYINALVSYSKTESNTLSVYDAGASGTSSSVKTSTSKGDMTNILVNATKQMRRWHTTFNLSANILISGRERMRSGVRMDVKSTACILTGKIDTYQFGDIVSAAFTGSYSRQWQSFGGIMPEQSFNDLSLRGKIGIYPIKKLEMYVSANYSKVKIGEDNYKSNVFIDAGISYAFKKILIDITARNLTDMRRYVYTVYHTLDVTQNSYSLRPREAVLTVKYSF